jgi:hypothetical protein
VNLLADNINTIKKNTEAIIGARKEVGLKAHTEKTKYLLMSPYKNAGAKS